MEVLVLAMQLRFEKKLFATEKGMEAFIQLAKAYFAGGGQQLSINVLSSEELLDAQLHPEQYADLIVRVGGFSAGEAGKGAQHDRSHQQSQVFSHLNSLLIHIYLIIAIYHKIHQKTIVILRKISNFVQNISKADCRLAFVFLDSILVLDTVFWSPSFNCCISDDCCCHDRTFIC